MKNVLLFGYGNMGSFIARGWMLKKLNYNFFIIEKEIYLRNIALKDGWKAYENIELVVKKKYLHKHQPEFIRPCTEWIRDFDKVKVFKTEELDELLEFFRQHFKGKKADNNLGVSKSTKTKGLKSYKDLYNEKSKSIIKQVFDDDFKNFGYEK